MSLRNKLARLFSLRIKLLDGAHRPPLWVVAGLLRFSRVPVPREVRMSHQFFLDMDEWCFSWQHGGRRIAYFRHWDGEWVDLSEMHTAEDCRDHAYCQWHGGL
jgi:hypothetical protein